MDEILLTPVRELCEKTDGALWSAFQRDSRPPFAPSPTVRLVFPYSAAGKRRRLRVSEQEARFALVESLTGSPFLYSAETPTRESYQFAGSKPTAAQIDLTLYDRQDRHVLNVEFKSGGTSVAAKRDAGMANDIEKLLREPGDGMWFHLFESVNNASLANLFGVLSKVVSEKAAQFAPRVDSKLLIFHVCVLEHGFSLHKSLRFSPNRADENTLSGFFRFEHKIAHRRLHEVFEANDWHCHVRADPRLPV